MVVLTGVEEGEIFRFFVFEEERVGKVNFEPFVLIVKERHQLNTPVWSLTRRVPKLSVDRLNFTRTFMSLDGIPMLLINLFNIRGQMI